MHIKTAFALGLPLLFTATAQSAQTAFQSTRGNSGSDSQWTKFNSTIKRVAVIGAGPAGLQAAAALSSHDFTVRLFDRAPGPGGNWFYSEEVPVREPYPDEETPSKPKIPTKLPASQFYKEGEEGLSLDERWREHWLPRPIWHSLHTNSPAVITELPDVSYPADAPWVISAHLIQRHVRAYASVHGLNANDGLDPASVVASYSTRVEKLTKNGSTWTVVLRKLTRLYESNRIKAEWWTEDFDAVVVATGPYDSAHVPVIDGLVEWSKVRESPGGRYSIAHSRTYRTPERFNGKIVLVLGAGTSASEIARDIDGHAKHIYASTRPHDVYHPFEIRALRRFPASAEFIPEIKSFGPLDSYDKGIKNGKITLINGTVLENIDEIILATGYRRANPFLSEILNKDKDDGSDQEPFYGSRLKNVDWTGLYIPDPTLAFTTVRPWTIGKYQSLAFAKVWEGTARLPNEETLWRHYNDTTGRWNNFRGLFGTASSEAVARQFVAWLNNESLELGGRFVDNWPLENRQVFVYYANQEWLQGYISIQNFTLLENTPAKDWGKAATWDITVSEDDTW